jgi:predicted RND superfamily exporter protein
LQAQFLIPMAVSISFGLAYATVLILFVIPALVSKIEEMREKRAANQQDKQAVQLQTE